MDERLYGETLLLCFSRVERAGQQKASAKVGPVSFHFHRKFASKERLQGRVKKVSNNRVGKKYHVALSFAGKQRETALKINQMLKEYPGIRVFYDMGFEVPMWGKSIPGYLQDIYENQAYSIAMFISKEYGEKPFPKLEKDFSLQNYLENGGIILPIRFDNTEIPGLPKTVAYVKFTTCEEVAEKIVQKLEEEKIYFGSTPQENRFKVSRKIKMDSRQTRIFVEDENANPVSGADIVLFNPNGTAKRGETGEDGIVNFENMSQNGFHTIFCAHAAFPGIVIDNFDNKENLEIKARKEFGIASVIFNSTGYLLGIKGRLNPILDENRRYLYADNIAVNGQARATAHHFKYMENIHLEDCDGNATNIRFLRMIQNFSILDYTTNS